MNMKSFLFISGCGGKTTVKCHLLMSAGNTSIGDYCCLVTSLLNQRGQSHDEHEKKWMTDLFYLANLKNVYFPFYCLCSLLCEAIFYAVLISNLIYFFCTIAIAGQKNNFIISLSLIFNIFL